MNLTDTQTDVLIVMLFLCFVGAIGIAAERYIRRHPRNRYTRKARRWPTDGNTHTSYWSGCKRVGVE
jgi:ABC-type Fe3+ transport system permease subunit